MNSLDQYTGTAGKKRLEKALKAHEMIAKNSAMARDFAKQAVVEEFADGATLLKQDAKDNDLYMIIDGEVAIEVNGNRVATTAAGAPVGELAIVDPKGGRSASVVAIKDTVVARISRPKFLTLAKKYPSVWSAIARHLARHVRRHNARFK